MVRCSRAWGAIKVSKLESLRRHDPCGEWQRRGEGYLMVPFRDRVLFGVMMSQGGIVSCREFAIERAGEVQSASLSYAILA